MVDGVCPKKTVPPSEYRQVMSTVTRDEASGRFSVGNIFARNLDKELKL
jgi:hypothetical protein